MRLAIIILSTIVFLLIPINFDTFFSIDLTTFEYNAIFKLVFPFNINKLLENERKNGFKLKKTGKKFFDIVSVKSVQALFITSPENVATACIMSSSFHLAFDFLFSYLSTRHKEAILTKRTIVDKNSQAAFYVNTKESIFIYQIFAMIIFAILEISKSKKEKTNG